MKVCGLTGGVGMGKSTAAGFFLRLGARVVDTDELARQLVQPGQPALSEIQNQFGVGVIAAMFDLTREKLMEMRAFVWCYEKVMAFHHFADRLIAPYKEAVMREWRAWRQRMKDYRARLRTEESK